MTPPFRHTKITFTVGPATESAEALETLVEEGVDLMRLNMAHATHEWTRATVQRLRGICGRLGRHVSVMMDVKGPEIRTGVVGGPPIKLEPGEQFDLVTHFEDEQGIERDGIRAVTVNYPDMGHDVVKGGMLLVDSGLVRMKVLEVMEDRVRCEVIIPGPIGDRRHINLPGVRVNLPTLTEKDRNDIQLGAELGVDFFALSFVREPEDLDVFRRYVADKMPHAKVIAKVEDQSGITNLSDIITSADALMVARGDLGIEIAFEELPLIQHRAVKECIAQGKPVIIATHMLESMINDPLPTRAEVTDVSSAVLERADSIMLSGETTTGKYPLECVRVMKRIARRMEASQPFEYNRELRLRTPKAKMLRSAVVLAQELESAGILVFTRSGYLAQMLSSLRATHTPIFAFTDKKEPFYQMLLMWGVEPFLMDFSDHRETTIRDAFRYLHRTGWVDVDEWMVVITNALASEKVIDTLQMRKVEL